MSDLVIDPAAFCDLRAVLNVSDAIDSVKATRDGDGWQVEFSNATACVRMRLSHDVAAALVRGVT